MQESSATYGPFLFLWLCLTLMGACAASAPAPRAQPVTPRATRVVPTQPVQEGLYTADQALRDALSGPLEYLGTGPWPGVDRMFACVFRNPRVLVVNAYCSLNETNALRVDVYSPTRGRVRFYAETKGPISARSRQDYFTFTAESEPPAGAEAHLPALNLGMSYAALRDYDQRRYAAYLPACFAGTEFYRTREGCLGTLAPRKAEWVSQNRAFLEYVNNDWYRLVRELRGLATRYGREPD
jgi:hypothetical protein